MTTLPFGQNVRPLTSCAMLLLCGALSACGIFSSEEILPGDREPIRPDAAAELLPAESVPLQIAPATENLVWTHKGGSPSHRIENPALSDAPSRIWSISVGTGSSRDGRITSGPVVGIAGILTLDAGGTVTSTDFSGARQWQARLVPDGEAPQEAFGGGVAVVGERAYVTTGLGQVVTLDATTGEEIWRRRFDAPFRSAPTVAAERLIVVDRSNTAHGLDRQTGQTVWRIRGAETGVAMIAAAQPAFTDGIGLIPFASGEVQAVFSRTGRRLWSTVIASGRRGIARASIGEITADPVVDGITVYAGNQSGALVSIDGRNGQRNWTLSEGARDLPTLTADSLFFVTDQGVLTRVDRESGSLIWTTPLDTEIQGSDTRQRAFYGPVMAGGQLYVAQSDADILVFDPATGEQVRRILLAGGAAAAPAVARNTLLVLSNTGFLHAFQ